MHDVQAFVASAADVFRLRGPICRIECHRDPDGDDLALAALLQARFGQLADVRSPPDHRRKAVRLPFPDGAVRTLLCIGVRQFAAGQEKVAAEIRRVLAPGGVLLACVSVSHPPSRPELASWRPTPRTMARLLEGMDATLIGWQGAETHPHTIYGIGFKPPANVTAVEETGRFIDAFQRRLKMAVKDGDGPNRWWRFLTAWLPLRPARRRSDCQIQFLMHLAVDRSAAQTASLGAPHDEKTGTRLDLMD